MNAPLPAQRAAILRQRRALKMARSIHAYVRGSTARFYEWLLSSSRVALPAGPQLWICGDCHVGNLGPLGRCEGAAVVELRDLDQAAISNPAFDLARLALSLAMAARGSDLPGVTTARMTEDLIAGYEAAFDGERPKEAIDKLPSPIRMVMKRAIKRTWQHLFDERIGEGPRHELPIGRRFWPLSDDERAAVTAIVSEESVRRLVTALESRADDADVSFLDAAYWVKGCSSLGLWRGAVLVEVGRKKRDRKMCLLDIKEATDAFVPSDSKELPQHQGARVVAGARALAPALGARIVAATLLEKPVFVRELLPQDLKVELDVLSPEEARAVAHYLGMVVGRAHSRQLDGTTRAEWMREIASHRTKNIEAPNWLWQSVVELVALHERAYLEHCRRYALDALEQ